MEPYNSRKTQKMRTDTSHPNHKKCFIFTEKSLPDFAPILSLPGTYANRKISYFCKFLQFYRKSINPVKVPWDMTRFPGIGIVYTDENLISIIYNLSLAFRGDMTRFSEIGIVYPDKITEVIMQTETQTYSSQSTDRLTEEQQDFILRKIAAFLPIREIVEKFRNGFPVRSRASDRPDSALSDQQLYNKIRYIANDKKTDKWRTKIGEYREQLRKRPINSYAIGNQFDRIRILQKLIDIAIQPNLHRVLWYPVTKDPDGTVHYAKEEIWEPNYHAAMRGILLVHRELQLAG